MCIVNKLLYLQHAAHLPTTKNLLHVNDLLAQHIYFSLLRTDKYIIISNEKYHLLCLDIAPG